jgi:hypothetical protein
LTLSLSENEPVSEEESLRWLLTVASRFVPLKTLSSSGAAGYLKRALAENRNLWATVLNCLLEVVQEFIEGEVTLPRQWQFDLEGRQDQERTRSALSDQIEFVMDWKLLETVRKRRALAKP